MTQTSNLKAKIDSIIQKRYRDPKDYESFANDLIDLGITRFYFDVYKNDMSFYTRDEFVHSLEREDIKKARQHEIWVFGERLDTPKLKNAIGELDAGKLAIPDFHRELCEEGVVFVKAYLELRKIYYLGKDAAFYLEEY